MNDDDIKEMLMRKREASLAEIRNTKVFHFDLPYIVFDIDGTLANIKHRLHYIKSEPATNSYEEINGTGKPDWDSFNAAMHEDKINPHIAAINKSMCGREYGRVSYPAIIVTGRPDIYREVTEKWLSHHGINYCYLFMRAKDDYRSDVNIKREIAERNIADAKVLFVIDDRSKVVDMWRELGYKCLQCQKGDY